VKSAHTTVSLLIKKIPSASCRYTALLFNFAVNLECPSDFAGWVELPNCLMATFGCVFRKSSKQSVCFEYLSQMMHLGILRVRASVAGSLGSSLLASAAPVFRCGCLAFLPLVWEDSDFRWALLEDFEVLSSVALAIVNHKSEEWENGERENKERNNGGRNEDMMIRYVCVCTRNSGPQRPAVDSAAIIPLLPCFLELSWLSGLLS
jgi:hypothetical protein